ncbi:NADH dehydrogenase (quinone) subunit G [Syntrophotalea acetylenivorans]|uniref:NADH dehydrogenase (Quinone) subunit G n=2 Tax=Syntrophotalea acetylenivorans TaxID=1842532 RepID=A0A1L3GPZ4_9BACT|nr:NADH dehydrogenase (quinone) subunit G [Syntrophotalea acetylenivorans]
MPTLIIDNQSVTVPEGTNVLEAAQQLGIVVPHFCYHEALGAVGACRLCAMLFIDGPVKGIQMACMVPAKDDMVVSTEAPEAIAYRGQVIEWLMLNHPHDCPVCDEGGECQLQDMTIASGHSVRRYTGKKRTYQNQDLGSFISHEMNRCIQCYRCVRTYQDYCGGTDYGVLGSNQRLYFGRFQDGPLESPFAGNLVDVCPTGVLTNKPYRFTSRFWDLQEAPSVCPHCSLGCATIPGARFRELQRIRSGNNPEVNGCFICDRGRFGYDYVNHPDRPRTPLLHGEELPWNEAIETLLQRLRELIDRHGRDSVALLGSGRSSLEANYLLGCLSKQLGCTAPVYGSHAGRDRAARAAADLPVELSASLADVRNSDLLVLTGADPLAEGPMLAVAIRQAVRNGGRVMICDPRPVELPCSAEYLPCQPQELPQLLSVLSQGGALPDKFQPLAEALQQAQRPVLIGASDLLGATGNTALLAAAQTMNSTERPCRAMVLLPEANSFGAALLAADGPDFEQLLEGMASGRIKALLCLEADPLADCPDRQLLLQGLEKLDFLAVLDHLPSLTAEKADLLLPTTALSEGTGTLINNEGRMQTFTKVFNPGEPLRISSQGSHPPRSFSSVTPGALPCQAWAILAELCDLPVDLTKIRRKLAASESRLAELPNLLAEGPGQRIQTGGKTLPQLPSVATDQVDSLQLLVCETLYGSESLSALSAPLDPVRSQPYLLLHQLDATRLGIANDDLVLLSAGDAQLTLPARLSDRMAAGIIIVPHLRNTELDIFYPGRQPLPCRVEKVSAP